MLSFLSAKTRPVAAAEALPGRAQPIATAREHFVNGRALSRPIPPGSRRRFSAWAASGAPSASSGRPAKAYR